jgi:hypothetical protein
VRQPPARRRWRNHPIDATRNVIVHVAHSSPCLLKLLCPTHPPSALAVAALQQQLLKANQQVEDIAKDIDLRVLCQVRACCTHALAPDFTAWC